MNHLEEVKAIESKDDGLKVTVYRDSSLGASATPYRVIFRDTDADQTIEVRWMSTKEAAIKYAATLIKN